MLTIEELKTLIKEIDESSIHEFSYEKDNTKIKLKKSPQKNEVQQIIERVAPAALEAPVAQEVVKQADAIAAPEKTEDETSAEAGTTQITSPMVGTFYRKPSPESDNYVSIGDKVDNSTVVCIVEAMKLFNEIEAEVSGEILDILVEDGELVEYGQPLFTVKVN